MKLSCEKYIVKLNSLVPWGIGVITGMCCFRSLICQLEEIDPGKLKHEEKLAFWINIHNALVMHVIIILKTMFPYNTFSFLSLD